MLHQVAELKAGVQALLQGINLSKVSNLNGALERAARTVVQQADVPEASGMETITLYSGVDYYTAPPTIFGTAINLIRRQGDVQSYWGENYKVDTENFTRGKHQFPNGYLMDFEYLNGNGRIGISTNDTDPAITLDSMGETTGWVSAGSASQTIVDNTVYYHNPASLRFTLTGASAGTLTKTIATQDLSSYEGVGVVFLAVWAPNATDLTSLTLRLGSSTADYFEVTATEGFLGEIQSNNWQLVAFDLAGAPETGTVDIDNVDYAQLSFAHAATITNIRVGGLWVALPNPHEILFQSSAIFRTPANVMSQIITSDGDTIVLNDAAYQLLEHESALTIAIQQGGDLSSGFIQTLRLILYGGGNDPGLYDRYRANNPSAQLRTIGSYYDGERGGYSSYV